MKGLVCCGLETVLKWQRRIFSSCLAVKLFIEYFKCYSRSRKRNICLKFIINCFGRMKILSCSWEWMSLLLFNMNCLQRNLVHHFTGNVWKIKLLSNNPVHSSESFFMHCEEWGGRLRRIPFISGMYAGTLNNSHCASLIANWTCMRWFMPQVSLGWWARSSPLCSWELGLWPAAKFGAAGPCC